MDYFFNDIPHYGEGWKVFVTKDGIIEGKYDYLFYEAALLHLDIPEKGWVVKYDQLENWFDEKLPKFGLNEKEKRQFVEYWIEELPESNYYEIKLFDKKFVDENLTLDISPKPETIIRLLFHFKALDENANIEEPISEKHIRIRNMTSRAKEPKRIAVPIVVLILQMPP